MKIFRKITLIALVFFAISSLTEKTDIASANTSGISYLQFLPEYPENQDANTNGYFNLIMEPGQQQTIRIKLVNNSDEPMQINIIKTNALTTQNGGIHYTEEEGSDISYILNENFLVSRYMNVQESILLPAKSTEILFIQLTAPKEKGTYLGGILFTSEDKDESDSEAKIQITNEVRVGTAILMNVGERTVPEIEIKESIVEIYPSGIQLQTRLENTTPSLVKSYKVHYKVFNEQDELLFEGGTEQFDMAPFSGIMFPSYWNHDQFNEGQYKIEMTIQGDGNTFTKTNEFQIKKADTKKYINTTPAENGKPIVKNTNMTLIYALAAIIIVLIAYIIYTKRKKGTEGQEP